MASQSQTETTEKNRAILEATEKIETVMSIEEVEPPENQVYLPGVPPMPPGYTLLWCVVLIAQALMLWWHKRK